MDYINPFHIIGDVVNTDTVINTTAIKRAKKRYLAEFELLEATTIDINGQEFDKNSLIQFFDKLENAKHLAFHQFIFEKTALLNFLETGDLSVFYSSDIFGKYTGDKEFLAFVSPYFAAQYNKMLYQFVKENDLRGVEVLVEYPVQIDDKYLGDAYQLTYRLLKKRTIELKDIAAQLAKKEHVLGSEIIAFFHPSFLEIFNLLPDYFKGVRSEYADVVDGIAVDLHNNSRRTGLAVELLEAAMLLKINDRVKYRLDYVWKQLKPHYKEKRTKYVDDTKSWFHYFMIIFRIILFFAILFRLLK